MHGNQIDRTMQKEVFKTLIKEGQNEIQEIELYQRPFDFEEQGRYVLVGIRQAGKSYLLYQRAKQFLAEGHDIKEFVYINFDDERLYGMKVEDFDLILQAYNTMYSYKPILFFDEIQNIEGWEHFARRLANQKYRVFITGSNAKMLSRDIATTLGARYFDEKVFLSLSKNIWLPKALRSKRTGSMASKKYSTATLFGILQMGRLPGTSSL